MTRDALTGAHAHLQALEGQTAQLQAQADSEGQALEAAQRAARDGSGTLRQVVAAQGQADAARGVLSLHLGEIEQQRGHVRALEAAHGVAQLVERGQAAQQEIKRTAQEAAQLVETAEAALTEALTRLQALEAAHSSARGQTWEAARQHIAQALGLTADEVRYAVRWDRHDLGPTGAAGIERRQAVEQALSDFAMQIGTSARELTATANSAAPALVSGRLANLTRR